MLKVVTLFAGGKQWQVLVYTGSGWCLAWGSYSTIITVFLKAANHLYPPQSKVRRGISLKISPEILLAGVHLSIRVGDPHASTISLPCTVTGWFQNDLVAKFRVPA